jgi:hypothetical protein
VVCSSFLFSLGSDNKNRPVDRKPFEPEVGEELVYKVSYAFFSLGEIRLRVLDKVVTDDKVFYKTLAYIDSYKGIPFVNLHDTYESTMNRNIFSNWFRSQSLDNSETRFVTYNFDYPNKKIYFEFGKVGGKVVTDKDTASIDTFAQDGLSLFYFARQNLFRGETVRIPTIVNEKVANTTINFLNKIESVEIDAMDYSIDVVAFDGLADFEGIFGFTGKFEGWFSNDNERVPILAKMKVLIGKVKIELIKWTKNNWKPPAAIK